MNKMVISFAALVMSAGFAYADEPTDANVPTGYEVPGCLYERHCESEDDFLWRVMFQFDNEQGADESFGSDAGGDE